MKRYVKFKCVVIFFLFVLVGCKEKKGVERDADIKITRFENILFSLDKDYPNLSQIDSNDYRFLELYSYAVLGLGNIYNEDFPEFLSYFLSDSTMRIVYDTVRNKFPNLIGVERELSGAFYRFKNLFPEKDVPNIYTHVSGFNQSIIVDDNLIGIGLDNYLGSDCVFYRMLANPIPIYIKAKMIPENIVRDVAYGWISTEFPFHPEKNDLVSGMIHEGKMIYIMEKLLPKYKLHRLFAYQPEELKWCMDNEREIWTFLVQNEYLFSTQQMILRKYLTEGPFSPEMPQESPGRAVVFSGYKIISKYVKKTSISLEELVNEQDYHKILRVAAYRP